MRFLDRRGTPLVDIDDLLLKRMFALAQRTLPNETGGILIGEYDLTRTTAVVRCVSKAPKDSIATPSTFQRGTRGLDRLLRRAWGRGLYYVGEWHFHPEARPHASDTDEKQMREFAKDERMQCPEPILLIVGHPAMEQCVAAYRFSGRLEALHVAPPYLS